MNNCDALETFVTTAADLYVTDPGYRAELEAEREPAKPQFEGPMTPDEMLDEVQWLINLGVGSFEAAGQVGLTTDQVAAIAYRERRLPLARIMRGTDDYTFCGPGESWAIKWMAGKAA